MAINIKQLSSNPGISETKYIYSDIQIDIVSDPTPLSQSMNNKGTSTDIKASLDEGAIMNSIKNIFTTTPGEKILNPTFGVNLTRWLFEPISEFNGREIGEAIITGLNRFEPRVQLNNVSVIVDEEESMYEITLVLTIPTLNIINKNYKAILGQPGFDFLGNVS